MNFEVRIVRMTNGFLGLTFIKKEAKMICPECESGNITLAHTPLDLKDDYFDVFCIACSARFKVYFLTPAMIEAVRRVINCPDGSGCIVCNDELNDAYANALKESEHETTATDEIKSDED